MSRATPEMRKLAGRVLAAENGSNRPGASRTLTTGFNVCEKLRPTLATLMGNSGSRALFARALTVAAQDLPRLSSVKMQPDGTLDGWAEMEAALDRGEILEGRAILVAHLLGLLVAFIGASLTLRLVAGVWPNLTGEDVDQGNGDKK